MDLFYLLIYYSDFNHHYSLGIYFANLLLKDPTISSLQKDSIIISQFPLKCFFEILFIIHFHQAIYLIFPKTSLIFQEIVSMHYSLLLSILASLLLQQVIIILKHLFDFLTLVLSLTSYLIIIL